MLREEQLEDHARKRGIDRTRKQVNRAMSKGRGGETPGGIGLIKRAVAPVAQAIEKFIEEVYSGKPGRRATAARILRKHDVEADLAAYIASKKAINAGLQRYPLTRLANEIGVAIEDEIRLAAFENTEPRLYNTVARRLRERGSTPDHSRTVFIYTANKFDVDLPSLSQTDKVQLGIKLVELFMEATGLIKLHLDRRVTSTSYKTVWKVGIAPEAGDWIKGSNERAELLRPLLMPTVVPPRPWEGLRGGGYHTEALRHLPLVKDMKRAHERLLEQADLSHVYAGLNAIQATPWRINRRVYDIMRDVWLREVEIAMPNREDLPLPEKPFDIAENAESRKDWKARARRIHEANAKSRGKRLSIEMMIETAEVLKDEERIYFPHQLDFRGRAYAMPIELHPQGPDHAKALLTFADGKPIDTPRAAGWLMIHGANLFGYDKVDLEGRIIWVEENEERIIKIAADPFSDLWWTEADGGKKAWMFLAWCFEYAAFQEHGFGYVSSLPVSVDGSCNGLQHFSAMLRDPVGGAAVNLVPGEKPNDIYQRVADRVIEMFKRKQDDWMARGWIDFGIDRKITKRPVMVLPYGGTYRSCLGYVQAAVNEKIAHGVVNPFGEELYKAKSELAKTVWHSITDVVVAARQAMDWLQKVARVAGKHNYSPAWKTPSGFVARKDYWQTRPRRVKTRLHGSLVYLTLQNDNRKIDRRRQAQSISPNFVHSMDAAAMMLTIELALTKGLSQFAMIHDSYGTVAADMDALATCLREAFVTMYTDHNVLEEFLRGLPPEIQAECPPLPAMGTLDLNAVRQSDFFFA